MKILYNKVGLCVNCKWYKYFKTPICNGQMDLSPETQRIEYEGSILCLGWGLKDDLNDAS